MRRRLSQRVRRALPVVLVMVLAASCGGGGDGDETSSDATGPQTGGAGPASESPAATAEPVSLDEYDAALAEVDADLEQAIRQLRKKGTPPRVAEAASELRERVDSARSDLVDLAPPEEAGEAHGELDTALASLSGDLADLEAAASSQEVCTGDAAVRRLSNGEGSAAFRRVAANLAEVGAGDDLSDGAFVPKERKERKRRGRNGDIRPGRRNGIGQMQITGPSSTDAMIKLRSGGRTIRDVYVRKGATVTVENLPDGNYKIFMTSGTDFDRKRRRFTRDCSFTEFDDTMKYRTTASQYTVVQLQLTEVIGGNMTSNDVDPGQFPD